MIAIVGMAGRFPGAKTLDAFWENLRDGVESIIPLSDEEILPFDAALLRSPTYVKSAALLDDVGFFDARFFNFSPREAELTDPQQRLFLECCWEALEHAGYNPTGNEGAVGVYGGMSLNTYLGHLLADQKARSGASWFQIVIGNDKDFLATRVAYKLNLTGPSVTVQTACSTSLVAVHLASQALLNGECDMALAGGVSVRLPQKRGYVHRPGDILSSDGHCRAFDARADGTIGGSGVGVVVLKRLADAVRDRDQVLAIIRGSAINNDGSMKVGYTAPSLERQAAVVAEALTVAEVDPATVSYIEAHGTGTALGDPIEVAALSRAFEGTNTIGSCGIGSVKTNIGHLDAAAGAAGLIKVVLALQHRVLPPSLHFETPNPKLGLANSPFYVVASQRPWSAGDTPRRAGVSSFGIGGTNAHVVVEEAPALAASAPSRPWHLLPLSAKSPAALARAGQNLLRFLETHPEIDLADAAYTLQVGRAAFAHRRTVLCRDRADLGPSFESAALTASVEDGSVPVAFVFPGQGSQYAGMTAELYRTERVFRDEVDACADILTPLLGLDLRDALYGAAAGASDRPAFDTITIQPALFVTSYALARLWMHWGVRPAAVIGHSVGEYAAACVAGVLSRDDALTLIAERSRLVQGLPGGAMLAVHMTAERAAALIEGEDGRDISLAAINGPSTCVLSGSTDAMDRFESRLARERVARKRLQTSHAFHSAMIDPITDRFAEAVGRVRMHAPLIQYASSVTGRWSEDDEITQPHYWVRQLRETVRFADGLKEVLREPRRVLIEIGPGNTLTLAAKGCLAKGQAAIASLPRPSVRESERATILQAAGQIWLAGVAIDWTRVAADAPRRRVALPTYPFEREKYYVERALPTTTASDQTLVTKRPDVGEWFYVPSWTPHPLQRMRSGEPPTRWLVFTDRFGVGDAVVERLRAAGHEAIRVAAGAAFAKRGEHDYTINPHATASRPNEYETLIKACRVGDELPNRIVHCWGLTGGEAEGDESAAFDHVQDLGLHSAVQLSAAVAKFGAAQAAHLFVIARGVHRVLPGDRPDPVRSMVLAACKVVPQEHVHITCRVIDVERVPDGESRPTLVDDLMAELSSRSAEPVVCYRNGERYAPGCTPLPLAQPDAHQTLLRPGGAYLITGGLGHIGLVLAEYLARTARARLALVTRSALPPREQWDEWVDAHPASDQMAERIAAVKRLEEAGADVLVIGADVCDEPAMIQAIEAAEARFGPLRGVIHAAGVTGRRSFNPVARLVGEGRHRAYSRDVTCAKVEGVIALQRALGDRPLDFCLLMSSLSSILGGIGFTTYAAGNVFLDTFAARRRAMGDARWTAVNWDGWDFRDEAQRDAIGAGSSVHLAMTPAEGAAAFARLLSVLPIAQVIVSTGDLNQRVRQWIHLDGVRRVARAEPVAAPAVPAPNTAVNGPRDDVERAVAEVWRDALGVASVGRDDNFFDLGGHSLLALEIAARLSDRLRTRVSVQSLIEAPTVARLADAIKGIGRAPEARADASPLLALQTKGAKRPFFCVHPLGGGAFMYGPLAAYLGTGRPFYGLQAVALDQIGEYDDTIEGLARRYVEGMRAVQPAGPYLLAGYSFGSVVAFEMARQLEQNGDAVAFLGLIDCEPPQPMTEIPEQVRNLTIYHPRLLAVYGREVVLHHRKRRPRWGMTIQSLAALDPEERLKTVYREFVRHQFLSQDSDPSFVQRNLEGVVARIKATFGYRPGPYHGPVTLFRGNRVGTLSADLLPIEVAMDVGETGWQGLCSEKIAIVIVPGQHEHLVLEPHVRTLAKRLGAALNEADEVATCRSSESIADLASVAHANALNS